MKKAAYLAAFFIQGKDCLQVVLFYAGKGLQLFQNHTIINWKDITTLLEMVWRIMCLNEKNRSAQYHRYGSLLTRQTKA